MSDISFPGLGAFVVFLGLLLLLGIILLFSLVRLVRGKGKWPCNPLFGFGMGSIVGIIITLILLFLTEYGSISLMEVLDHWAVTIAILLVLNTLFMGGWYLRKNSKNNHRKRFKNH